MELMAEMSNHGGYRPNSGRPKKEPTKIISFRVPVSLISKIKPILDKIIKSYLESI